jgi:large subunit ribosomal protein L10
MMEKEKKAEVIKELKDKFLRAKSVVFTDYTGMTVAEMSELRSLLKSASVEYRVIKNNLARIAAQDTPLSVLKEEHYRGPIGIALSYNDPLLGVKKVFEFIEKNEKLKIKTSVVEGRLFSPEELKELSKLPPREVLLGMLAGGLAQPLQQFASLLHAVVANLAYALEALKRKREAV